MTDPAKKRDIDRLFRFMRKWKTEWAQARPKPTNPCSFCHSLQIRVVCPHEHAVCVDCLPSPNTFCAVCHPERIQVQVQEMTSEWDPFIYQR